MRQVTFLDRRLGIEAPEPEEVPAEVREPSVAPEGAAVPP
jgi:hypothetical protein